MNSYHFFLFGFVYGTAELKIRRDLHGLFDGQISMELIVLHNVTRKFSEGAEVPLVSVHCDAPIHSSCSAMKKMAKIYNRR